MAKLRALRRRVEDSGGNIPTATMKLAAWLEHWMSVIAVEHVRPKTLAGYRSVIKNHVIPAIGHKRLDKITPEDIRGMHDRILSTPKKADKPDGEKLSSTYALNAHRVLSVALEEALTEGHISRNPAKMMRAPRKAVVELEVLDRDEAKQIFNFVKNDSEMGARWIAALLTAARRGELIGLERDRVTDSLDLSWQLQRLKLTDTGKPVVPRDFEYRHLIDGLYLTRPKSLAGWRVIPLVEPLHSILHAHMDFAEPNPWGLVFTRRGRPIDPDQDSKAWREVLAKSQIAKDVRLHDLRHTAIDLLYLAQVPEDLIVEIVGHANRVQTRAYKSRGNDARLRGAMESVSALFSDSPAGLGMRPEVVASHRARLQAPRGLEPTG
ncbi:integrase [Mycetocola sp. BIGb0189]|uniref:tyrosine-type recombinase/integrase n=1 Tax=Mycetocola sp. BIGb0189 TaxID=2940604 RepID=UPI00216A78B5|nr:site-specific integrase [Mycetocola sp. BIGb0189]MCS4277908.1 integrase [Mycetocola sp. BIGb0189]